MCLGEERGGLIVIVNRGRGIKSKGVKGVTTKNLQQSEKGVFSLFKKVEFNSLERRGMAGVALWIR